ncbi:MAG TPA: hypothetical protein VIS76_01790, partial [Pseudomonadales bacterium]
EADLLAYPVILPTSVDPTYSDIAQRYLHHDLPPPVPHYVTDDWELIKDLVRCSDAYHALVYQEDVPIEDEGLRVLQGVIKMSEHKVSIAFSRLNPKSEAAALFERMMRQSAH